MNPIQQLVTENIGLWTGADTAKKFGRGRASGSAGTVYGIKKLRELILELAVSGKLVPQYADDEPASALLQKIRDEKARLILDGKVKKDKPLAAIMDDEKPFSLPQRWSWVRLGNLLPEFQNGASSRGDVNGNSVVVLRLADIKDRRISLDDSRKLLIHQKMIDKYHLSIGDTLIVRVNGSSDLVGGFIVCDEHFDGIYCDHFIRMRISHEILLPGFIALVGASRLIRDQIENLFITTAGQKTVNQAHISSLILPLLSIAEQHRIVAKVDELMAMCDQLEVGHADAVDAHEKLVSNLLTMLTGSQDSADFSASWQRIAAHFDMLFTTESSIDALKQTLLQLAVMGKLVPQDPSEEPANALLERIQAEKARLFFEGKIKKNKLLTAIVDDENLFFLPQGWERINLGAIIELISGQHLNPNEYFDSQDVGSIPYITGPADFGNIGPVPVRYTFERRSLSLFDDVLLTVKGSGVGKINTVSQPELAISRQLMAVRPIVVGTKFIERLLLSMAETFQDLSIGIAIPGISREDVLNSIVALPPIAEQHRIVAKVDELMALCDRMKARIVDAAALQRKLADVMVAQAVA